MSWSNGLTYKGMLALLDDQKLQIHMRLFGAFQFKKYIESEIKDPKEDIVYLLRETGYRKSTREFKISGKKIVNRLLEDSKKQKVDFPEYFRTLHLMSLQKVMQGVLSDFYEIIKNYKSHKNPLMIKELNREDWFRMLSILRDHYSHFSNMGKPIVFPDRQPFKVISKITWNGLTIKKGQMAESIPFSFEYISELITYGIEFLKNNEATLK